VYLYRRNKDKFPVNISTAVFAFQQDRSHNFQKGSANITKLVDRFFALV